MALYDRIGVGYDTTRQADPYLLSRLIHHLHPNHTGRYLEVGSGTGNYTTAMHRAGVEIYGLELSQTMLEAARRKGPAIAWLNAHAQAIPFAPSSFDGAISTFVHHHLSDPLTCFREVHRVLKQGARFVILNGTAEQTRRSWLIEYFPRAMEKAVAPYARFETVQVLNGAGFQIECEEKYDVRPDLKDMFLFCGKNRPELYLDPRILSGISFFADAPDADEIARGVQGLADDIETGRINRVIRSHEHDLGDYMFTVASKSA